MKKITAALFLSVALWAPTKAEQQLTTQEIMGGERISAHDMINAYDSALPLLQERIRVRFRDTYTGMSWVNIRGKVNMFCEPDNAPLIGEFLVEMMRGHLKRSPDDGGWPWQFVLLKATIATFPCKQGK